VRITNALKVLAVEVVEPSPQAQAFKIGCIKLCRSAKDFGEQRNFGHWLFSEKSTIASLFN
jgi:hypothetical protein